MTAASPTLVVEDGFVVSCEISEWVADLYTRVMESALDGDRGLTLDKHDHPEMGFMNIRLQGSMDGITAAEELRRRHDLPVSFVTACSGDAFLAGADCHCPAASSR